MPRPLRSDYFEAIVQLRPFNDEVFRFIQNQIKKRNDVEITRVEKLKTGIDIYITSQRYARSLGKKLKDTFNKGELKISYKLHTRDRQTSKEKFRATVLFRLE